MERFTGGLMVGVVAGAWLMVAVACAAGTAPGVRATGGLAAACDSIGSALAALAPLRAAGKLSTGQQATVTGIRDATAPYCASTSIVQPETVVAFVMASAAQLSALAK